MSVCPRCGTSTQEGAQFCQSCGHRLSQPAPNAPQSFTERYARTSYGQPVSPATTHPQQVLAGSSLVVLGFFLLVGAAAAGGYVYLQGNAARVSSDVGTIASTPRPTAPGLTDDVEPTFELVTPPPVQDPQALVGEPIQLVDALDGSELGSVTVLSFKKYSSLSSLEPERGYVWVGVKVRYVASGAFSFNPFDFVAHDDRRTQYESAGHDLIPSLDSGTLAKGRKKEGWISFEVPKATKHLWVDYQDADGNVVFSVKVF